MVRTSSGCRRERLVADPARRDRQVPRDESIEPLLDGRLLEPPVEIEIEAPFLRRQLPAGHRRIDHRTEQMQAGMHAHVAMTALPVKRGDHAAPRRRRWGIGVDQVKDVVGGRALARVVHRDHGAVVCAKDPGIAGLAAAFGIEDGAVEPHAVGCRCADPRLAGPRVGVRAEKRLSRLHHGRHPARVAPADRARAGTRG